MRGWGRARWWRDLMYTSKVHLFGYGPSIGKLLTERYPQPLGGNRSWLQRDAATHDPVVLVSRRVPDYLEAPAPISDEGSARGGVHFQRFWAVWKIVRFCFGGLGCGATTCDRSPDESMQLALVDLIPQSLKRCVSAHRVSRGPKRGSFLLFRRRENYFRNDTAVLVCHRLRAIFQCALA